MGFGQNEISFFTYDLLSLLKLVIARSNDDFIDYRIGRIE